MPLRFRAQGPIDADVAIVGAGPAGAAAACHFARAGFRVTLIDQHCFPRDKACGDFVGPCGLAELDGIGLSSQPPFRDANRILHGALYIDGDKVIGRPFPRVDGLRGYGLCIPRMLLDDLIVQAAVACGARLIEEARVTGYETDRTGVTLFHQGKRGRQSLRTRLLIGADGSSSLISRILRGAPPPRRDRIVAVRAYFEGVFESADRADLYFSSSSFPGYSWLFPTGTTSANVGVGMLLEAWSPTQQQLSQLLARLIESDPALGLRLAKAKMFGKIVGWPLTTFNPQLPIIANRVALIGDAAGLINPLTGEGIQYALRSARWSAEELRDPLSIDSLAPAGLRSYAARVHAEMRYDMALSRLIIDLVRNRALNPLWLSVLELIGKRAASDLDYYDIAAGVFAGVAPAKEAVALPFLWRTIQSAAMAGYAAANDALRGQRRNATFANSVASMFKHLLGHPVATLHWGECCASRAFELATQMAISARQNSVKENRGIITSSRGNGGADMRAGGVHPGTVLHWYDFICPFCYVGQHRNAILIQHGLDVVELPFQAHPDIPPGGISAGPRVGPMSAMLEREAKEAGLPLHWPARLPDTRRALAAAEWARRHQPTSFPQLHRELFAAHFALGEDLEDPDVIDRHASASGVDLAAMHAALADGSAGQAVTEAETIGRKYGVQGTPAWLLDQQLITGLRPAAEFERLAEQAVHASR